MSDGFLTPQPETPVLQPETVPEAPVQEVTSVQADEQALEQAAEQADTFLEGEAEAGPLPVEQAGEQAAGGTTTSVGAAQKDEVTIAVEKILEEDLGTYFKTMPQDAQERFHKKGEEIAYQIADMVRTFKVKVRKVLTLIHDWLMTIPGVNKFFLEQEAKIKTDRILGLQESRREEPPKP